MDTEKDHTDIIIIKGAPASGKSETAKLLAKLFPKGVRLEVDKIRSMVISVDWTNQNEHITMLQISARLAYDYFRAGFNPIIVVDTFSGDKVIRFIEDMLKLNPSLSIKVFTLIVSEEELRKRLVERNEPSFRDYGICAKLNSDNNIHRVENEILIDTSIAAPEHIVNIIADKLEKL